MKTGKMLLYLKIIFFISQYSNVIMNTGQSKTFNIASQTRNFAIRWDYKAHAYDLI